MGAKKIGDSNYVGVGKYTANGKDEFWMAQTKIGGTQWEKRSESERDAAKAYDIKMIQLGKEPVNILVRK